MAKTQGGLGAGSRPYGLGAPAMQPAPPGYGGTPSPTMGTQPGGALGVSMPSPQLGGGPLGISMQPSQLGGQTLNASQVPGAPGVTPPGVPPQLASIWHLLPPQLQAIFGGQSPIGGLLGGQQGGSPFGGGIAGLLQHQQQPQQATPPHMQASGNPNPVPQSYQTPSTPLAGATFGGPGQGASGNPYPVSQAYY